MLQIRLSKLFVLLYICTGQYIWYNTEQTVKVVTPKKQSDGSICTELEKCYLKL